MQILLRLGEVLKSRQQRLLAGTDVALTKPHPKNVAVIGRERSLRFPGMTPAFYVCNLAQTFSRGLELNYKPFQL